MYFTDSRAKQDSEDRETKHPAAVLSADKVKGLGILGIGPVLLSSSAASLMLVPVFFFATIVLAILFFLCRVAGPWKVTCFLTLRTFSDSLDHLKRSFISTRGRTLSF